MENRLSRVCGSEQSKASQEGPEEFPMFSLSLHSPTAQLGGKPAEGVSPFFSLFFWNPREFTQILLHRGFYLCSEDSMSTSYTGK